MKRRSSRDAETDARNHDDCDSASDVEGSSVSVEQDGLMTDHGHVVSLPEAASFYRPTLRYFRVMQNHRGIPRTVQDVREYVTLDKEGTQTNQNRTVLHKLTFVKDQDVYGLPASFPLSQTAGFKSACILGIDASSVLAVEGLRLSRGDVVLDLCCAPGTKLAVMADIVGPTGFIIGVDTAPHRLDVVISVVKKYKLSNVGLLLADGQDENLFSRGLEDILTKMGGEWNNWSLPYTRHRKSRTRRRVQRELDASTVRRLAEQLHWDRLPSRNGIFDKVLVDAECTHDGSVKHVEKYVSRHGWERYRRTLLHPDRLKKLFTLQRNLLLAGIRHVRPGGLVLYSTCSLSSDQNENVVASVLSEPKSSVALHGLPFTLKCTTECKENDDKRDVPAVPVNIGKNSSNLAACRFEPHLSNMSGLFMCCLRKLDVPAAVAAAAISADESAIRR